MRLAEVVPAAFRAAIKEETPQAIGIDGGIESQAMAPIEATQPCARKCRGQDSCDDPLAILDDRSNIDKHRTHLLIIG